MSSATQQSFDGVRAEIAGLGEHFTFLNSEQLPVGQEWRPVQDLWAGAGTLLHQRYTQVQLVLTSMSENPVELRVAASVGHLGLIARLLCPAIGAALFGYRLELNLASFQNVVGGTMPLAFPSSALGPVGPLDDLLIGPIAQLSECTALLSLSPKVIRGNISSAVNGAVSTIARNRPDLASRALELGRHFLPHPGPKFRRDSCCLIYRIAPPGSRTYCGDCVLNSG